MKKPQPPPTTPALFSPGQVLTLTEIAERLKLDPRTIRRRLPEPDFDLGARSKRWNAETVNRYLIKESQQPKGAKR